MLLQIYHTRMQTAIPRLSSYNETEKRDMTGNKIQPLWSVIIKALLSSQHIVLELIIYRNISFSCIFIGIHTCNTLHSAHNLDIYSLY